MAAPRLDTSLAGLLWINRLAGAYVPGPTSSARSRFLNRLWARFCFTLNLLYIANSIVSICQPSKLGSDRRLLMGLITDTTRCGITLYQIGNSLLLADRWEPMFEALQVMQSQFSSPEMVRSQKKHLYGIFTLVYLILTTLLGLISKRGAIESGDYLRTQYSSLIPQSVTMTTPLRVVSALDIAYRSCSMRGMSVGYGIVSYLMGREIHIDLKALESQLIQLKMQKTHSRGQYITIGQDQLTHLMHYHLALRHVILCFSAYYGLQLGVWCVFYAVYQTLHLNTIIWVVLIDRSHSGSLMLSFLTLLVTALLFSYGVVLSFAAIQMDNVRLVRLLDELAARHYEVKIFRSFDQDQVYPTSRSSDHFELTRWDRVNQAFTRRRSSVVSVLEREEHNQVATLIDRFRILVSCEDVSLNLWGVTFMQRGHHIEIHQALISYLIIALQVTFLLN